MLTCSGVAGFLVNWRVSVAPSLSVHLLSKLSPTQKEKSEGIRIDAIVERGNGPKDLKTRINGKHTVPLMICSQALECFCYFTIEEQLFIRQ